ncbi:hypothetical protein Bca52824_039665 [Brassica carinata]|uniref:Uncharacterized protein n=1 Tax=Brassica carinata TaxID=52824 RepID=A0A8X7UX41_BRACI|nr:hypothetical protein Bca52824_039665 [Brassica carinata]
MGANLPTMMLGGDTSTREKAKDDQTYDVEDSESEPEPDKEAPNGAVRMESPMIAHLHQMFSERLEAMQSMMGSFRASDDVLEMVEPGALTFPEEELHALTCGG